jgi:PAS domain S-box-containing protein
MSDNQQMEPRLLEWLRQTSDLFCVHAFDGRILAVNQAVCKASGYSEQSLLEMNLAQILASETRGALSSYLERIRTEGKATGRMVVRTAAGARRIWKYDNVRVAEDAICGVARDVTEDDEHVSALTASERRFRTLVENSPDVIMILGTDGTVRYHSPSAIDALRLEYGPWGGILGCKFQRVVLAEDRALVEAAIARVVAATDAVERIDVRVQRRGGELRSFEINFTAVMRRGRAERIILNARDVTERKMLEQQLEQANRLNSLGRLAATVAHEFNNVLMGMMPFAELLRRDNLKPDLVRTSTGHILTSIQRGKRVALDVLRFTQPAEPTMVPLQLDEWWERFLPEVVAIFGNHVRVESDVEPVAIAADSIQLTQLFSNLVSNAKDAMSSGGVLTVRTRTPRVGEVFSFGVVPEAQRYVQITVRDTGEGIAPELLRHVFDPLFTTKRNGGTGLGLAVVHHVVTRHGGFIFVESEVGVGTAFHVFLPKTQSVDHAKDSAASEVLPKPTLRSVLLVDDERLIVDGLVALLEMEDFEVTIAENGHEALQEIERHTPDLVVLDIGLPDIDGLEVGKRIRERHPQLPIVFATGHGDSRAIPNDPRTALLRKPFQLAELLARIAGLEQGEAS